MEYEELDPINLFNLGIVIRIQIEILFALDVLNEGGDYNEDINEWGNEILHLLVVGNLLLFIQVERQVCHESVESGEENHDKGVYDFLAAGGYERLFGCEVEFSVEDQSEGNHESLEEYDEEGVESVVVRIEGGGEEM